MKKLVTSLVTILTVATLGIASVFAAGSTSDVVEVAGCKDSAGNDVAYTVTETSIPPLTVEIASTINGVPSNELKILWQNDITADVLPCTITYNINGTDGLELYSYHWNGSAWELMNYGVGPTISTTYTSLSPVCLVVRQPADAPADTTSDSNTTTSPKTGSVEIIAALSVIVVAASAAYVVATKKV